jgi:hypothetical protein
VVGSSVCAGVDLRLWDLRAGGLRGGAAAYVGLGVVVLGGRLECRNYRLPVYDSGPHVVCLDYKVEESFIAVGELSCLLISNDLSEGQHPGSVCTLHSAERRLLHP